MFLRRGQTSTKIVGYMFMHTKILAQVYFLFGYLASVAMFIRPELYLKFMGIFLASYLSYLISAQLEQNND